MIVKNKIAIVTTYFGKLPNYFSLWLKSCCYNPSIDFFLFTDQRVQELPPNVTCVAMTLAKMKERATKVLGFDAVLSRPYKCCDYKPLYGLIFRDYLAAYDYWGHCDVDLIFGDLQKFFDENNLYDYDKFGMLGHLSLFKNTDCVNHSFMLPKGCMDYRNVYTNEKNMAFDELAGVSTAMKEVGFKVFAKRVFADIATTYYRYRLINVYPLDNKPINYKYQTFYWQEGKAYHIYMKDGRLCKEEYLYIHFQKRPNYKIDSQLLSSDSFFITNHGFFSGALENLTESEIQVLNPYRGKLYEILENKCKLFKRRISGIIKRMLSN